MLNRLKWITVSYVTSPAVLVLVALGAFVWMIGRILPSPLLQNNSYHSFLSSGAVSIRSREMLDYVRRTGRELEVDEIDLGALWSDMASRTKVWDDARGEETIERPLPDEDFFHILREFPNLRIVHINFFGNDRGIEELAKLRHLSELQIYGLLGLPVGSVQSIAWISQLKHLQILQVNCLGSRLTGFEALADLQHLKLIDFESGCSDATLQAVASLPHLAQLAIDELQTKGNPPTRKGFEALRRAPVLKTVRLFSWRPGFKSDLLAIAQAALPNCLVTSTPPPGVQPERAPQAWMAMFILAVALGVQLSAQFRNPASRLAPHFVWAHAWPALGLSAALIGWTVWQFTLAGFTWISAFALATAGLTATIAATAAMTLTAVSQREDRRRHLGLLLLVPVVILLFLPLVLGAPQLFEDRAWLLTTVPMTASVAFAALAVWVLHGLARGSTESEAAGGRIGGLGTNWRTNWLTNLTRRDHQFERWLNAPATRTGWQRVRRWRLGNPPVSWGRMALIVCASAVLLLVVMQKLFPVVKEFPLTALRGFAMLVIAFATFPGAAMLINRWRARARLLPLEATRPGWDHTIRREMATAMAIDLTPPALVFAASEALVWNLQEGPRIAWSTVPVSFLTSLLLGFSLLLSCAAVAVVVRRVWLAIVIGAGPLILEQLLFFWLIRTGVVLNAPLLQALLWIPIVTSLGIVILAQRRWRTMEWADFG